MALFSWNPHDALGVPEIDTAHVGLFVLADELHAALAQGLSLELVRNRLSALIDGTRAHFAHEEGLMLRNAYPRYQQHKAEHDDLIRQALDFQREVAAQRIAVSAGMLQFLKDWLTRHIRESDRLVADYLQLEGAAVGR